MKIPRFWARQIVDGVVAYGWSFSSHAEAEEKARANAQAITQRLALGTIGDRGKLYYADRPVREPIMREFHDSSGAVNALITRNVYGALVLNTANALFADVDFPTPRRGARLAGSGFFKLLASLFSSKPPAPPTPPPSVEVHLQPILEKARAWAAANPGWQWRIYRTKAGVRLLATHALFEPAAPQVLQAFEAVGADPLYRKLCANQQCFRARLTPKPWRCGYHAPQVRWPFANAEVEAKHDEWQKDYLVQCGQWSTCELVEDHGAIHPEIAPLVAFHDAATRVGSGLPLA